MPDAATPLIRRAMPEDHEGTQRGCALPDGVHADAHADVQADVPADLHAVAWLHPKVPVPGWSAA